jgi:hypothetical protein
MGEMVAELRQALIELPLANSDPNGSTEDIALFHRRSISQCSMV